MSTKEARARGYYGSTVDVNTDVISQDIAQQEEADIIEDQASQ